MGVDVRIALAPQDSPDLLEIVGVAGKLERAFDNILSLHEISKSYVHVMNGLQVIPFRPRRAPTRYSSQEKARRRNAVPPLRTISPCAGTTCSGPASIKARSFALAAARRRNVKRISSGG